MSKYTQGPWKISGQLSDGIKITAPRDLVAKVYGAGEIGNAALIAAAPEMYEFIKSLIKSETNPLIVDHCRALIAKARGES